MKILSLVSMPALALALSGCGVFPKNSGVMQLGPDSYRLIARAAWGGELDSERFALQEAKDFCASLQMELQVTGGRAYRTYDGSYEVSFKCLKPGSAEARPKP